MTREEAIEEIKNYEKYPNGLSKECRDYIVKALEQEPTTKNDLGVDLVSRAEVLKLMQDNWHTHNGDWAMQESMDDIRALPSVTPQEPRKGHWILRDVEGVGRIWFCKCSECGKDPQDYISGTEDWWLTKSNLPNYCPNCGSDNREVRE